MTFCAFPFPSSSKSDWVRDSMELSLEESSADFLGTLAASSYES